MPTAKEEHTVWDSIFNALSGPLLAKLALLAILIAAFSFLRRKDTEGVMVGYATVAFFLCLRDVLFTIFPNVALYNASDIALFCALLYLGQKPFRLGWAFWLPLALAVAGIILLILEAVGLALPVPPDLIRLVALAPVLAGALMPLALKAEADTPVRILMRIALPLVMPGITVASILAFVYSWNYFQFALVLSHSDSKTLVAAAFNFIGEGATFWGALMAAATLITLPPLLLAFAVQRRLVSGLSLGAVKG
jgi:ABC-type Fe3+ transport system permease subunit